MTARTLNRVDALIAAGLAPADARADLDAVAARYAVAVTPAVAALIDPADPHDPIARQFVPSRAELETRPEERADPIGDDVHSPVPGIVHRYPDRALLKAVTICPVYCRFCFRRESVGPAHGGLLPEAELEGAFAYLAAHREIWEVILTGGDPLVLAPRRLEALMRRLAALDHVKVVRLHTRVPAVDPDHVDAALVAALKACGKTVYVALHANHPRELGPAARAACARLVEAGIVMISQSVLLRGVNDDVETLASLMRGFVEARVTPYYLHHPDLAPGTAHFRLSIAEGQALVRALRGRVSGLCQPTYVLDIPGGAGKSPIGPEYLHAGEEGAEIEDWRGRRHAYPPAPAPSGRGRSA
ncbi:lysine-2,3-aminomutase-like protein [Salinarimonas chemoclinalis]|uniref:lysine-2,3-aminomutase-like protein n=1 Tax=Salinarimonas chemoclinalis TaxID=3241599 RepID=UPI003557E4B7